MTESDQHAKLVAHEKVEKTDEEKKAIGEFVRFRLHKISNRIKKEDLKNYVEEKIEEIRSEYDSIPFEQYFKCIVANKPENIFKNRYFYTEAYDYNRVVLRIHVDDYDTNDYIAANYVDGYESRRKFIASQSPLQNTINDYWRMIWDTDTVLIVSLTRLVENGHLKSAKYWPDTGNETYGRIKITTKSVKAFGNYLLREYILECDAETREVKQYFYQGWPDCNLPRESKSILCLLQEVRQSAKLCSGKQVVVQCSAGCGRTGCFILMWNMIEMAEREGYVDIAKYAAQLRAQRAYAIGGFEQYLFVYKALANYFDQSD